MVFRLKLGGVGADYAASWHARRVDFDEFFTTIHIISTGLKIVLAAICFEIQQAA